MNGNPTGNGHFSEHKNRSHGKKRRNCECQSAEKYPCDELKLEN